MNTQFWLVQAFNGLSYGALLFLVGSGLSLIFGVMRIVNLSHGSYFLLGGYIALSVIHATGSWALSLPVAALAVAALGLVMERLFLRSQGFESFRNAAIAIGLGVLAALAAVRGHFIGNGWSPFILVAAVVALGSFSFSPASRLSRSRPTFCARCCLPSASPSCFSRAHSISGAATTWTSIRRARSRKASSSAASIFRSIAFS